MRKIHNSQNYSDIKWPLNGHFKNVLSQKLLADIAEHICQINRKSDENVFLKRAN